MRASIERILTGLLIGLLIYSLACSFGERPYDDTALKDKVAKLSEEIKIQSKLQAENITRQDKVIEDQTEAIKYLTAVLGSHQEVIISNQEEIRQLAKDTVKDITIKK